MELRRASLQGRSSSGRAGTPTQPSSPSAKGTASPCCLQGPAATATGPTTSGPFLYPCWSFSPPRAPAGPQPMKPRGHRLPLLCAPSRTPKPQRWPCVPPLPPPWAALPAPVPGTLLPLLWPLQERGCWVRHAWSSARGASPAARRGVLSPPPQALPRAHAASAQEGCAHSSHCLAPNPHLVGEGPDSGRNWASSGFSSGPITSTS